jgi:hypothetical protein
MRRGSFAAPLAFIGLGAVLAFAVQGHAQDFNLNLAGFIIMVTAVVDLVLRALIGDDPLLPPDAAQIAAVIEPLGEPVLDAYGRPITVDPGAGYPDRTIPEPTRVLPPGMAVQDAHSFRPVPAAPPPDLMPPRYITVPDDIALRPDQVLRTPGDYSVSADVAPVSPFTGRRIPLRRRRRR